MSIITVSGSENMEALVAEDKKREAKEKRISWIKEQAASCMIPENSAVGDFAARMGTAMSHRELERRLKRLNPSLVFENIKGNSRAKRLSIQRPDGIHRLFAYSTGHLPERSVARVVIEETPDPTYLQGRVMERSELPAHEKKEDGSLEFDPDAKRPGYIYTEKNMGEKIRGWRTVLLLLIVNDIFTVEEIEREFGASNTAEWALHTKKRGDDVAQEMEWK
jgi:hypothetical protein